jgi:hypothetical protein
MGKPFSISRLEGTGREDDINTCMYVKEINYNEMEWILLAQNRLHHVEHNERE